jgi:hypothetical protein
MQEKVNHFWEYAGTLKSAVRLEDAFLKWAAMNKLTFVEAQDAWEKIYVATANAFNRKTALTLSGTPEEISDFQKSDNTSVPEKPELPPQMQVEPPKEEEPGATILDEFATPEGVAPKPAEQAGAGQPTPPAGGGGAMPEALPPLPGA